MALVREYAEGTIPKIYVQRVGKQHYDTLYAVWMERNGVRISACIEACCTEWAKADFIATYFIVDKAEAELNRMYALEDKRQENSGGRK
jgi:hypothetical protein